MSRKNAVRKWRTADMARIALFAVVLTVCAWLSIPLTVPITMQSFGVFLTLLLLGGRSGTLAIVVYLLLGAVGMPVFSGFRGGIGMLLGATGGYLTGFLAEALVFWTMERLAGKTPGKRLCAILVGHLLCYCFGTAWYLALYAQSSLWSVLCICVLPYLLPDLVKLVLAWKLSGRLNRADSRYLQP